MEIPFKYADFANIFLPDFAMGLSENNGINEYAIKLIDNKQLSYKPIYALNPVELKIFKSCLKTHFEIKFM